MNVKSSLAISDTGFIFDPETGNSYTSNPIGVEIIGHLKKGKSSDEIKHHIIEQYDIDESTAEKDLLDFVGMLNHFQLIKQ